MIETGMSVFFGLVVVYALFALWLGRFSITMPMLFVFAGAFFGAYGFGLIEFSFTTPDIERWTEITLALLLFADASTLNFNQVKDDASWPGRLVVFGMPLIILLGGLLAFILFPDERIGFALLLGTILAPTDAALGMPIFNNPRVPVRVRRALNVESGLNDGIASPLVVLFVALALEEMGNIGGRHPFRLCDSKLTARSYRVYGDHRHIDVPICMGDLWRHHCYPTVPKLQYQSPCLRAIEPDSHPHDPSRHRHDQDAHAH
jgi:NhaP-type Na+/H+ or K+/H+ antiporter